MDNVGMISRSMDRVLLAGTLLLFLVSEANVVVVSVGWPHHETLSAQLGLGQLFVNVFLTSIPFVAGIHGYMVAKRVQSKFDAADREEARFVWLGRQYLAGIACTYVALISIMESLSKAFHPR